MQVGICYTIMMRISHTFISRLSLALVVSLLFYTLEVSAQALRKPTFMDYIRTYQAEARRQMDRHAIPASITLAQGLIETGAGTSTLARDHNNHFGIKCHSTWTGKRTYRQDDNPNDCFRSYPSAKDSYDDHSMFLKARRYQRLFALRYDDYRGWAKGLQLCGYVESERTYDRPMRPSYISYGLLYVLADQNDTYDRIAADMGISAKKLAKYNDTPLDYPLNEGDVVYLEPKNKEASARYSTYTVRVGDSMHEISQRYGIRLDQLYKLNNKDADYAPEEGDVLRLR